jgi:hypothetical protein
MGEALHNCIWGDRLHRESMFFYGYWIWFANISSTLDAALFVFLNNELNVFILP